MILSSHFLARLSEFTLDLNIIYKDIFFYDKAIRPANGAYFFAGQGNPAVGMGADLWDLNTTTRQIWDCASDVTGLDLRRLCQKGPMNRLVKTTTQQSAVTAINITLYSLYAERFADANVVGSCGHSVGEYSALYAAGALTLEKCVQANIGALYYHGRFKQYS